MRRQLGAVVLPTHDPLGHVSARGCESGAAREASCQRQSL